MTSGRMEAFSDGVFAVAITVLVFGLRPGPGATLTQQLLNAWPHYFAYVVSFLTIGIMWMNHHTILGHVNRVNRPLLVLNLLLLMGVVAIPFPTDLVATHLLHAGGKAAAVTYGLVMIAIAAGFSGMWVYVATHADALGTVVPRHALRQSIPGFTLGAAAYVVGTLVAAFVSATAGLAIFGLLAVYYLFDHLPSPAEAAGDALGGADGVIPEAEPGD
jgi:TMEM175 potassium channel family protein